MINNIHFYIISQVFQKSVSLESLSAYDSENLSLDEKNILDYSNNPQPITSLIVGDIVYQDENNNMKSLYFTPNRLYSIEKHLAYLNLPGIIKTKFKSFRCFSYLTNDFTIILVFSFIENCMMRKQSQILKSLLPKISELSDHLKVFINIIENLNFEQGLFKIFKSYVKLSYLSSALYNFASRNYETLCLTLDISVCFISHNNIITNYLNPSGSININFFQVDNNFFILYKENLSTLSMINIANTVQVKTSRKTVEKKSIDNELVKIENSYKIFKSFLSIYANFNLINQFHSNFIQINKEPKLLEIVSEFIDYKRCIFCESLTDLVELDCKHKVCRTELLQWFQNSTSNTFELYLFQVQYCTKPACGTELTWDYFKKVFPDRIRYFCYHCRSPKTEAEMKISCKDICTDCATELFIDKRYACPSHSYFSVEDIALIRSIKRTCPGCDEEFVWVKYFPKRLCKHFLCFDCLSLSACPLRENCGDFGFTQVEIKMMKKFQCQSCRSIEERQQFFIQHKTCECLICYDCHVKQMIFDRCIYCGTGFNEDVVRFLQIKIKEFNEMPMKDCPICYYSFKNCEIISMMGCTHEICKNCFNNNAEESISDISKSSSLDKCPMPQCQRSIPPEQLVALVPPDILQKWEYFNMIRNLSIIQCPKCSTQFESLMQRKAVCVDKSCNYVFCKNCKADYHDYGDCDEVYLQERIRDMMRDTEGDGVTQCPRCRIPYLKDPGCQHVDCLNQNCRTSFCFQCACIRSPTITHGNHYHRPCCPFYNDYVGDDDKYDPNCTECLKAGTLCQKPQDLRQPRRVDKDEVVL